jgi:hypothetical protein
MCTIYKAEEIITNLKVLIMKKNLNNVINLETETMKCFSREMRGVQARAISKRTSLAS